VLWRQRCMRGDLRGHTGWRTVPGFSRPSPAVTEALLTLCVHGDTPSRPHAYTGLSMLRALVCRSEAEEEGRPAVVRRRREGQRNAA
jgi:hypothetical protein